MSNEHKRFCIFCGQQPQEKNNEHVIPRWLIEITGDPKRTIQVGPFASQKEPFKYFAFDQLQFPACGRCNSAYASMEDQTKTIMEKLLRLDKASAQDFDIFLDWFDKVRVGLWLGYHQFFDKNHWQITPNFYIADRIGTADRLLLIYRTKGAKARVHFAGVSMPAFAFSPTCFTLIVNDFFFVNISADFLLARRAGLPHPKSISVRDDNMLVIPAPLLPGTERIEYPVLGYDYDRHCTIIAQPIFKKYLEMMTETYTGDYVTQMSLAPGKIKPIVQRQSQASLYPDEASLDWLPINIRDSNNALHHSVIQTLRFQIEMLRRVRVWKEEDKAKKRPMKAKISKCIKINTEFVSWIKKDMMTSEN